MVNYKELSFNASLEGANSFKEFFISLDALMCLEWKVDFTMLGQLFCCRASAQCDLPKVTEVIKEEDEHAIEKVRVGLDFTKKYFHHVTTLDDMLMLKRNKPEIYQFYIEESHELYISSLNNSNIVRQTDLLLKDFKFKGIDDIKISSFYVRKPETASKVFECVKKIKAVMEIYSITLTMPEDPETAKKMIELQEWAEDNNIVIRVITEKQLLDEENVLAHEEVFEYWEEHTIYMVKDKFFLNKHDSLQLENSFYHIKGNAEPTQFMFNMIDKKIKIYGENIDRMNDNLQKQYYQWVSENTKAVWDYNFIPKVMYNKNTYFKSLLEEGYFIETPLGLLKKEKEQPKRITPIFLCK